MRMSEQEFRLLLQRSPATVSRKCLEQLAPKPKKSAKYRNHKVYVYADGYVSVDEKAPEHGKLTDVFDSVKEYNRWHELLLMERGRGITQLRRQVELLIQPAQVSAEGIKLRKIAYKADFVYTTSLGVTIVEDVKPFDTNQKKYRTTKDFNIKWKLLQAKYPEYSFRLY